MGMVGRALEARGSVLRCAAAARTQQAGCARAALRVAIGLSLLACAVILGVDRAWSKPPVRILMLGDSITAGLGLAEAESLPKVLEADLRAAGHDVLVLNGGVSGDTTADGLARLDWMLEEKPQIVIVELGANDALRGLDPKLSYDNLDKLLDILARAKLAVLLTGMMAPPNLGREYGERFAAIYPALASKYHCLLYPFLLEGVAAVPALNQADGIHPNARGVVVIASRLAPYVVKLLGG